MELSVVTLWSGKSLVQAEVAQYLLAESFSSPTQFYWVINTADRQTWQLLDQTSKGLLAKGHQVEYCICADTPRDGLFNKHQHVANLYNLVFPRLKTKLVLCLEDDNLPQPGAVAQATAGLSSNAQCGVLCGLYRSRMNPACACAALATDRWQQVPNYAMFPNAPVRVGFVGGGFTLFRLSALKAGLPVRATVVDGIIHGWDANLCLDVRRCGWEILLTGEIRVGHHCPEVVAWCARTGQPIA